MSGWWIVPSKGMVTIDDAPMADIDCSAVDPTIYLIRWWDTNGEILFNHDSRLPVRQPFTDLTPYIHLFDQWIVGAENPSRVFRTNEGSPPITLLQAKQVKSSMVDALFASKRQMPVSAYGYNWDASDNVTGAMTDEIAALSGTDAINSAVGALAASVNAAFQEMATDTHDAVQGLAGNVNSFTLSSDGARSADANSLNTSLSSQVTGHNANRAIVDGNFSSISNLHIESVPTSLPFQNPQGGIGTPSLPTTPVGGGITAPGVSAPTVAATPATGPDIAWPPLGGGPAVTLTYVQFTALLQIITSRRNSLQQVRTAHKNNIAGMTTVQQIAAYDITAGW